MAEPSTILAKLDELAAIRAASAQTRADYNARRDDILASVQAELDALKAEYGPVLQTAQERAEDLEAEVKELVRTHGQSVKNQFVSVSCSKPRVKWDTKRLEGFAAAHPEILQFRSEGPPTVTLRWLKVKSSARSQPEETGALEAEAGADEDEDLPF